MSVEARAKWLFEALGFSVPAPPPSPQPAAASGPPQMSMASSDGSVRPSEIVTGASGVQYSYGENTDQATANGQDFAQGSREAAKANKHDSNKFNAPSNPMQSPDMAEGAFFLRYGIGFLCGVYPPGWGNLGDITAYSKPTSAFLKAFTGMNKTQQYTNPKKSDITGQITSWIDALNKDLPEVAHGELVITFQGHGAHGSFFASDAGELTTGEIMAMAKKAEAKRVSLTVVMDACFSGGAVPAFQDHAADAVDHRVDTHVEGKGEVSSVENHERAEQLRDEMAQARELILFSAAVARHGDTLNSLAQGLTMPGTPQFWQSVNAENADVLKLVQAMEGQFKANMTFDHAPKELHDAILAAFKSTKAYLSAFAPSTAQDIDDWMNVIGKFQDQVSDNANRIISELKAASAPGS